jgi:uncharacterized protein
MLNFEKHREQALLQYLSFLGKRDAVLSYQQIQGLLYAMVCSPEPVKSAEWFELIWLSDDPHFDDPAEAKTFYRLLQELFRHIGEAARQERYRPGVDIGGQLSQAALSDWCDGFLMGHQYLENLWLVALDDLNDDTLYDQVEAALNSAVAFAERDVGNGDDGEVNLAAAHLQFQQSLNVYCSVHQRWYQGDSRWDVARLFEEMEPLGPDEPCSCGSGRPFRHCCLH